ncbi:rap guanine nucleotide exchange factor 1-like isoform X4 [Pomacea canaliculata]|uniref:rap guanine nucleotide exchange factor 1-like isoform X4 n=1 Tax=Pomacea canaliculata TaxID=400727 RepID=UPI000D738E82|nr:rap guanine nucleotide exchange factor 1-like isoform X4 [Pomacea canaliculata]
MVGSQGDAPQRSAIAQLLYNVHGPAMLDQGNTASTGRGTRRRRESRRLSLDSCRHQEGKTRVYVRSKDLNPHGPFVKEADRLRGEVEEVHRTLTYIRAVVQQGKLEILPETATLILETVMNVFTTLRNMPGAAADSTSLMSCQNKVCQSLARLIQWTDGLLVGPREAFSKESAHEIIDTLAAGIKELSQMWMDKMATQKPVSQKSSSPVGGLLAPPPDVVRRVSLPDIPLTPREQEILHQTSQLEAGSYDNVDSARTSAANENLFSFDHDCTAGPSPPPKPPLPAGANHLVPKLLQQSKTSGADVANGEESFPPPLPEKRRLHNSEMLSSVGSQVSMSGSRSSGQTTPTGSPHTSMVTSLSSDHALSTILSGTPLQSPQSISPGSSMSSNLNNSSSDDLSACPLAGTSTVVLSRSSHSSVMSRTSSESRIISSSVVKPECRAGGAGGGGRTFEEINALTSEIKKLTSSIEDIPPPLPAKKGSLQRLMSQYDNIPDTSTQVFTTSSVTSATSVVTSRTVVSRTMEAKFSSSSTQSSLQRASHSGLPFPFEERVSSSTHETYSSSETFSSASHSSTESLPKPPPLPPKKRHIQAYMQTFGALTQPLSLESISRHSINFYEAQWQQHQMELCQPPYPRSNTISVFSDISSDSSFSSGSPERFSGGAPALPAKSRRSFEVNRSSQVSTGSSQLESISLGEFSTSSHSQSHGALNLVDLEPPSRSSFPSVVHDVPLPKSPTTPFTPPTTVSSISTSNGTSPTVTVSASTKPEIQGDADSDFAELNPLDDVDVSDQLVRKREGEDGPEIRGGSIDALIVHATAAGKSEFIYQEAFLTTYRTFISPRALIEKLLYRFHKFHHAADGRKKLARNSFSLLIRVIDELGHTELDEEVVCRQVELVYELLCQGELGLARLLRRKLLEKCKKKQAVLELPPPVNPVQSIDLSSSMPDLLAFKSHDIAEQMTLLDAQLFQKIEIPEVLLWAKEQSEELSPNLATFTQHFNNMSYWCRTRILSQDDSKEREKYLMKFIKIMRYLRKLRNFNSYLAILSALDSAPVRRLEWQKQNVEALQEFCQLIDSSSSFRAYRQALAETEPPCIPYLGLILQDLTFINLGNQDALPDGSINFAKRWQQFHILDSMRRFKTSNYSFKRHEKIQCMMNNFEDFLGEEILWQISQKIKPRPTPKKQDHDSLS